MYKSMIFVVLITTFSIITGCATLTGREIRQKKVYNCTIKLIQEETEARDAEVVCSNIYTKKRR